MGAALPVNRIVARTGPSAASSHQPSLSAKSSSLLLGSDLRLAMTAEDDQAPGGVGKQVPKLHVDRLHELAA